MIPQPGSSSTCSASQPSRSSAESSRSTPRRRLSRSSEPRWTSTSNAPPSALTASWSATSSTTRLLAVAVVARTGMSGGSRVEGVPDAAVVGTEVVTPVRDAVGLVDHEQPDARRQRREHPVAEVGVVEPLRADQQDVDSRLGERLFDDLPLLGVGRVDRHRVDSGPTGSLDLVAHEGQQRRHDQRRPGPASAQEGRRHEVHGRLAPAGALDDERPPPAGDQRFDGRPLVVAQDGVVPADQSPEHTFGVIPHDRRPYRGGVSISRRRRRDPPPLG